MYKYYCVMDRNYCKSETRSGGPRSGGLERASRDQRGRDQRGHWPLRRVDCYGPKPLQGMGLVPHRLYVQSMWGLYTKWTLSPTRLAFELSSLVWYVTYFLSEIQICG
ncbi:hypothetical protein Hanom_Chr11g01019571 [Helianthus anomalus]